MSIHATIILVCLTSIVMFFIGYANGLETAIRDNRRLPTDTSLDRSASILVVIFSLVAVVDAIHWTISSFPMP